MYPSRGRNVPESDPAGPDHLNRGPRMPCGHARPRLIRQASYGATKRKNTEGVAGSMVTFTGLLAPPG